MKLYLHAFDLPLAHAFTITHESRTVQPTLIAELRDPDGKAGYGEATTTTYYGVYRDDLIKRLEGIRQIIEETPLTTPEQYWEDLRPHLHDMPFAQCMIDQAANDLWARRLGQRLGQLWRPPIGRALPPTSYTIGMADIPTMIAKMQERPWPIYKIKLGTDHDLDIVRALREHTQAVFRVDANTAWTAEQTVALAPALRELGVEFIEQPLKPADREGQAYVYAHCALPVIADESCHAEADVARCAGLFHGVNIKLMKCGGLTPARRMIAEANQLGLKTMVGCMTESSVGISAIAQLTPWLDYVDMDGALLLAKDPAKGVVIDTAGQAHYPDAPGTGVTLTGF